MQPGKPCQTYSIYKCRYKTRFSRHCFYNRRSVKAVNQIKKSGMDYTILKNKPLLRNVSDVLRGKFPENGVFFPAGTGKVPFAARIDMAGAAAHVLTRGARQ